jgi:hypothetical protein
VRTQVPVTEKTRQWCNPDLIHTSPYEEAGPLIMNEHDIHGFVAATFTSNFSSMINIDFYMLRGCI